MKTNNGLIFRVVVALLFTPLIMLFSGDTNLLMYSIPYICYLMYECQIPDSWKNETMNDIASIIIKIVLLSWLNSVIFHMDIIATITSSIVVYLIIELINYDEKIFESF